MPTDAELLHRYVHQKDEEAFTQFVHRNVGLVYSAALRRTGGRAHLAEEIAQKVFSDLSLKAATLTRHPALTGWLYQSTRYASIDAIRAEQRRQSLANSLSSMNDEDALSAPQADWGQLRSVLDEAMDKLKDDDRELMLLRFFNGLSFAELGRKLGLSENAARKRTERALEKLRVQLGRRGVTSTAAALTVLLSNQALTAAPASVAASVTAAALTTTPAAGMTGLLTVVLMNKFTSPLLSAAAAAGLSLLAWTATHQDLSSEISALRQENARLTSALASDAPTGSLGLIADEYSRQSSAIALAMVQQKAKHAAATKTKAGDNKVSTHGYSKLGQTSALDAIMTFAWASDVCDPEEFSKLVYFDTTTRAHAMKVLSTMPEAIRSNYPSAEQFYGFLLAASCMEAPPPSAAIAKRLFKVVELGQGRVATRVIGASWNMHEFQHTPEGWKYVFPATGIESAPQILDSKTLANLSRHPRAILP